MYRMLPRTANSKFTLSRSSGQTLALAALLVCGLSSPILAAPSTKDLEIKAALIGGDTARPREAIGSRLALEITNHGNRAISEYRLDVFASADAVLDASDKRLYTKRNMNDLAAGDTVRWSPPLHLRAPQALGSYHLIVVVDSSDEIRETSENNNTATVPLRVAGPYLIVSDFRIDGFFWVEQGESLAPRLSVEIWNLGESSTGSESLSFYLGWTRIGGASTLGPIAAGQSATLILDATTAIPFDAPTGLQQLAAQVDSRPYDWVTWASLWVNVLPAPVVVADPWGVVVPALFVGEPFVELAPVPEFEEEVAETLETPWNEVIEDEIFETIGVVEQAGAIQFLRGDCNSDSTVDISDGLFLLKHLFTGGNEPGCLQACDFSGENEVSLTGTINLMGHLFLGGPSLPAPFPQCGEADLSSELSCNQSACPVNGVTRCIDFSAEPLGQFYPSASTVTVSGQPDVQVQVYYSGGATIAEHDGAPGERFLESVETGAMIIELVQPAKASSIELALMQAGPDPLQIEVYSRYGRTRVATTTTSQYNTIEHFSFSGTELTTITISGPEALLHSVCFTE